jgi:hypothetical protein
MKQGMELNGIANISAVLQLEADVKDGKVVMNLETLSTIKEQLLFLERYMLAYNKAIRNGEQTPYWHEVRDNPTKYPLNKEIVD